MNISIFFLSIGIFVGCGLTEPKFIRAEIKDKNITVRWFYYSYISNNSPDFVEIEKNGTSKLIYQADDVVTSVCIKDEVIVLRLYQPQRGIVFTKDIPDEIFGYKIVLDSTATYDDYLTTPKGIKEKLAVVE